MKRIRTNIIAAAAAILCSAACSNPSIEERMAGFFEFCSGDTAVEEAVSKIGRVCPDRPYGSQGADDIIDYFTLKGHDLVNGRRIEIIDVPGGGRDIAIDIKGRKRKPKNVVLIAAPADTWTEKVTTVTADNDTVQLQVKRDNAVACAAALEIARAFKETGVKPNSTIRVLIYQEKGGKHAGLKPYVEYSLGRGENHIVQLYLTSDPNGQKKMFKIGEPKQIYRTFEKIIPPYFEKYGYAFERDEEITPEGWEIRDPFYTFNIDPENPAKDIAAAASLLTILD